MIRVCWATWWPAPYWEERFEYLSSKEEIDLDVVYLNRKGGLHNWDLSGISRTYRCKFIRNELDIKLGYQQKTWSRTLISIPFSFIPKKCDILVTPYADINFIGAIFLCILKKKPYFLFCANTRNDFRKSNGLNELWKKLLFSQATGILATGPLQRDYSLIYTKDENKISIIGNPTGSLKKEMDTEENREKLRIRFRWNASIVLIYVGRLSEEKGLIYLFHALEKLKTCLVRPILAVVGKGPLEASLRYAAMAKGINVEFLGYLQREELAKRYTAADIFVLPSMSETWGLVVNEAMEFGIPLILSDHVGCIPSLLQEGNNGMKFPSGDSERLSNCIRKLYSDKNLRRQMGISSRKIIQNHSINKWTQNVYNALHYNKV